MMQTLDEKSKSRIIKGFLTCVLAFGLKMLMDLVDLTPQVELATTAISYVIMIIGGSIIVIEGFRQELLINLFLLGFFGGLTLFCVESLVGLIAKAMYDVTLPSITPWYGIPCVLLILVVSVSHPRE